MKLAEAHARAEQRGARAIQALVRLQGARRAAMQSKVDALTLVAEIRHIDGGAAGAVGAALRPHGALATRAPAEAVGEEATGDEEAGDEATGDEAAVKGNGPTATESTAVGRGTRGPEAAITFAVARRPWHEVVGHGLMRLLGCAAADA